MRLMSLVAAEVAAMFKALLELSAPSPEKMRLPALIVVALV